MNRWQKKEYLKVPLIPHGSGFYVCLQYLKYKFPRTEPLKDVITEFRGRGDEVHMYPLSFAEFMSVYPGTKENGWREYVVYGGLPLVLNFKTPDKQT